eukprot:3289890-Pleurochrysis_carterae.AAC.5
MAVCRGAALTSGHQLSLAKLASNTCSQTQHQWDRSALSLISTSSGLDSSDAVEYGEKKSLRAWHGAGDNRRATKGWQAWSSNSKPMRHVLKL